MSDTPGVWVGFCERCGTKFVGFHPAKRFCTERCQRVAEKARYRARHRETVTCKGCGAEFERSSVDGPHRKVYCSLRCQAETRSSDYQEREHIQAGIRAARAAQGKAA